MAKTYTGEHSITPPGGNTFAKPAEEVQTSGNPDLNGSSQVGNGRTSRHAPTGNSHSAGEHGKRSGLSGLFDQAINSTTDDLHDLGIPNDKIDFLKSAIGKMFGGNVAMVDTIMTVIDALAKNGVQGQGVEIPDGTQVAYQTTSGKDLDARTPEQIAAANLQIKA